MTWRWKDYQTCNYDALNIDCWTVFKDKSILSHFDNEDVRGAINTRNFIAHDYEGINLPIIEFIIRERLPVLKKIINIIIDSSSIS